MTLLLQPGVTLLTWQQRGEKADEEGTNFPQHSPSSRHSSRRRRPRHTTTLKIQTKALNDETFCRKVNVFHHK